MYNNKRESMPTLRLGNSPIWCENYILLWLSVISTHPCLQFRSEAVKR